MANRTFLLKIDGPYTSVPHGAEDANSILAAASYMIPIFWYGLFSPDCLAQREAPTEDDEIVQYPVFQSKADVALERLAAFIPRARTLLPSLPARPVGDYVAFLKAAPGSWFAVETCELWMMDEPPSMEEQFHSCLTAAVNAPTVTAGWRFWKKVLSPTWRELFEQANVKPNSHKKLDLSSLFGYEWIVPVPWSD